MLRAEQLKEMPPRHEFARGDGEFPDLSPDPIRWVCIWSGVDWCIKVAPTTRNFKEVAEKGRIVDIPKIIQQIQPATDAAMKLYRK